MAKILHISKFYYPYFGGIEDVAATLVEELKPYHEQRVVCYNTNNATVEEIVSDIPVTRIGTMGIISSQPITYKALKSLQRIINEFRPDYIHLHLPNPLLSIALLQTSWYGAKLIVHWHSDILGHHVLYMLYRPFERHILKRAHTIIATSQQYLDYSKPLTPFKDKTIILPNTVNADKLTQQPGDEIAIAHIRAKWQNRKIIFFVGRHVPYKGLQYLIKSEPYLSPDCVIVIAGSGQLTRSMKVLAANSKRIHFIGSISNDELRHYLYASTLFAFPSNKRSEAFGVALAEALYCGLPAVSFRLEGSGTTWVNVDNQTGLVVPLNNIKAFAAAINHIVGNDQLHKRMSTNARAHIRSTFMRDRIWPILKHVYGTPNRPQQIPVGCINVSIVLYENCYEPVAQLVHTLRTSKNVAEIFLVDNSKKQEARFAMLPATYIFNHKNLGYGKGHNIAFYRTLTAHVPYHLAINADTKFDASILGTIATYMDHEPDIGALMPKVFYPSGKIQYLCRLLPTPMDLIGRRFLPNAWTEHRIARLEMHASDYNHLLDMPHISGCFMFIRTEALRRVGLFDPRYFLYMEDVDLTRRIRKCYRTVFYPKVSIVHVHEQGSYKNNRLLMVHITSAIRYFNKWGWRCDTERDRINAETLRQIETAEATDTKKKHHAQRR